VSVFVYASRDQVIVFVYASRDQVKAFYKTCKEQPLVLLLFKACPCKPSNIAHAPPGVPLQSLVPQSSTQCYLTLHLTVTAHLLRRSWSMHAFEMCAIGVCVPAGWPCSRRRSSMPWAKSPCRI